MINATVKGFRYGLIVTGILAIGFLAVQVAQAQVYQYNPYYPANQLNEGAARVRTLNAALISGNSAMLQAAVNPNSVQTSFNFEYGETQALGSTTPTQNMGGGNYDSTVTASLTNLRPGATYYFRVVARNPYGISNSTIGSFQTVSQPEPSSVPMSGANSSANSSANSATSATAKNTSVANRSGSGASTASTQKTYTVKSTATPATAKLAAAPASPSLVCIQFGAGLAEGKPVSDGEISYAIGYRNTCTFPLKDAGLLLSLPKGVQLLSTDRQFTLNGDQTVSYALGTIPPKGEGQVTVRGVVKRVVKANEDLTLTATLSFFDPAGDLQALVAFLTTRGTGNVQTASIFSILSGIATRWLVSIILIVIILALIVWTLIKRSRADRKEFVVV
ncbi:MAG: fibronectin type III domain-containing protein [Candidatus Liptonbacteria bacterium]|nr:fibronectin type III domain-containing protein [Candidatus Liptonbacteria bacterium]